MTTHTAGAPRTRPGPPEVNHNRSETDMTTTTTDRTLVQPRQVLSSDEVGYTTTALVAAEAEALASDLTDTERAAIKAYADALCQHGSDTSAFAEEVAHEDFGAIKSAKGGRAAKVAIDETLDLLADWTEYLDNLRHALQSARESGQATSSPAAEAFVLGEQNRLGTTRANFDQNAYGYLLRSVRTPA